MKNLFIGLVLSTAPLFLSAQVAESPSAIIDVECATCGCVSREQNLVKNGDFSSGNVAFTSDLTYVASGQLNASQYTITTNANTHNPQWLGSPTSPTQFFVADGASTDKVAWRSSNIGVQAGKKYNFCMRANNLQNPNSGSQSAQPRLFVRIKNVSTSSSTTLIPATVLQRVPDQWQLLNCTWTAPANVNSIQIEIVNMGAGLAGNDFGIDDISFGLLPTLSSAFTVATNDPNLNDGFYNITATAANNTLCQKMSYSICELSNPSNPSSPCVGPSSSYVNVTTTNFPGFGGTTPGKLQVGKYYRIVRKISCPCFQQTSSTVIVNYAPGAKQLQMKEVQGFVPDGDVQNPK